MEKLKMPDALDVSYWKGAAGASLDKAFKVGEMIKKLSDEAGKVSFKALDISGLDEKEYAKRRTDIEKVVLGPLNGLEDSLKKLEAEAKKALGDAKKAGKESAVQAILTGAKAFRADLSDALDEVAQVDEELKKAIETGRKAATKTADPKAAEALKKQVEKFGAFSRKAIRELQSGKVKQMPFAFGYCKTVKPLKPGTPWPELCLVYMHPKAGQSSRSLLQKYVPDMGWAMGVATCLDRKKINFNCEAGKANPKQLKDALKYQMKNYAPPMRVTRGNLVDGDEAGEGKDDEALPANLEEFDDADAAPDTGSDAAVAGADAAKDAATEKAEKAMDEVRRRLAVRSQEIQEAIGNGSAAAPALRKLTVDLSALLKDPKKAADAAALMAQIDKLLAGAGGAAAGTAISPELDQALRTLALARRAATNGASRVAELIRKSYEGDAQEKKAAEGAGRIDAANQKLLATTLETTLQAQLRGADARKRQQVAEVVQKLRDAIEKNELLPDIDKSPFDPALNVIGPYVASLKAMEAALRR